MIQGMTYGQLFRQTREATGRSQRDLAAETGINRVYISDVERGKRRPFLVSTTREIADTMGVNPMPLMVLATIDRGLDPGMLLGAKPESVDLLLRLTDLLPALSPANVADLKATLREIADG
jgi:transcriptional regulator with XRE-family HTH domain